MQCSDEEKAVCDAHEVDEFAISSLFSVEYISLLEMFSRIRERFYPFSRKKEMGKRLSHATHKKRRAASKLFPPSLKKTVRAK